MKPTSILLSSWAFHPALGGIETSSYLFAEEFTRRGHKVTVVTNSSGEEEGYPFRVVRQPSGMALARLVRHADLVWHNNVSLRPPWPFLWFQRPLLVTHQTWLGDSSAITPQVKRFFCMSATNVFISDAVKDRARLPGTIIPNPYEDRLFRVSPTTPRDQKIVFVGRLVGDKGVDVLLRAMAILQTQALMPTVTIIGDGPELSTLVALAHSLGLGDRINFRGALSGPPLAQELNRHRIMVVPSRWDEPFGIVALEGAACGCVVVGTRGGGLPEAIGPCGPIVEKDDPIQLAQALATILSDSGVLNAFREKADEHLAGFTIDAVADRYEEVFNDTVGLRAANYG
jgi:glycosyltransferase involved in cell wall biosynthesis